MLGTQSTRMLPDKEFKSSVVVDLFPESEPLKTQCIVLFNVYMFVLTILHKTAL